jgi:hypothetical protein
MRCARCDFENIPGQTRCIQCGSILEAEGPCTDIYPPRMPAWSKPFRRTARQLRHLHLLPGDAPGSRVGRQVRIALDNGILCLLLNVVPGLGCLLCGGFRKVLPLLFLWLVLLGAGLFLFGAPSSVFLIGLAIGVHAWIAVQGNLLKTITVFSERLGLVLLVIVLLIVLYFMTPRIIDLPISPVATIFAVPALKIQSGDQLLVRRIDDVNVVRTLPRGTLADVELRHHVHGYTGGTTTRNGANRMIGQIVGLPGETISIRHRAYFIGDKRLDPNAFPVPQWLQQYPLKSRLAIPAGEYFVSAVYRVDMHGRTVEDQDIAEVCIIGAADVHGRAFMRWLPLSRRGYIEYGP